MILSQAPILRRSPCAVRPGAQYKQGLREASFRSANDATRRVTLLSATAASG